LPKDLIGWGEEEIREAVECFVIKGGFMKEAMCKKDGVRT
jgi:hypothetical protein